MKGEQKKKEKVERKKRYRVFDPKDKYISKYWRDTMTTIAIASSLAKEAGGSTVGTNKTCFNRESKKNKHSCCISAITAGRVHAKV